MKPLADLRILIDRIPFAEGSLGEEAILGSLLHDLNACGIRHISVLSNQPERTLQRHANRVHVIPDKLWHWLLLPFRVKRSDLLIWGGGHMLQDRSSQLYIPYVVKTLLLAKLLRVPRFIYAPGLGPVVNWLGKFLSKQALKGCRESTVRDDGSLDFLNSIDLSQEFRPTADPAFTLQAPADGQSHLKTDDVPIIGFAPRRHFYRRGSMFPMSWQLTASRERNSHFEIFLKNAASALDLLVERKGARIRLIPMDIGPNPRDDLICYQLRQYMTYSDSADVMDDDPHLDEFVRRLGELDLLVSSRLHGIILGLRFGLPFIGIDSDGKIEKMAAAIDSRDYIIKDVDFERDLFYDLAVRALDQRQDIRRDLQHRGSIMRERANENRAILECCLQSISEGG